MRPYDGGSLCTAARFPMVGISPRLCSGRLKGRNPCRTLEPYRGPASSLLITSLIFAPSIRRSASLPLWASSITPPSGREALCSPTYTVLRTKQLLPAAHEQCRAVPLDPRVNTVIRACGWRALRTEAGTAPRIAPKAPRGHVRQFVDRLLSCNGQSRSCISRQTTV